jgi:hypothetical protein
MKDALRQNRLDPKVLYRTARQADLWRAVFRKHSPIHGNPEFTRIYQEAFAAVAAHAPARVHLIGLGCGTGFKERELCRALRALQREVVFSALDVSGDLVAEAARLLEAAGAERGRQIEGDLLETAGAFASVEPQLPRLLTFFGLCPNLMPAAVGRIFRSILRPGDELLASAHLAPARGDNPKDSLRAILPQYDNAETRAWLAEALVELGLADHLEPPSIEIGELDGIPAILGHARWRRDETLSREGETLSVRKDQPLRVFFSLRYTPEGFETMLRAQGFAAERLAVTTCGEEGIWSVRA